MTVRVLTLDDVPDELLAECGLIRGGAAAESYRCNDKLAVLIPTTEVIGPSARRKLNRDTLANILNGFRQGHAIQPVEVFYETATQPHQFVLLDGFHRWRASLAYGFRELPCLLMERDWAEVCRGYVRR
jgi:ParB-like nuclease domain